MYIMYLGHIKLKSLFSLALELLLILPLPTVIPRKYGLHGSVCYPLEHGQPSSGQTLAAIA